MSISLLNLIDLVESYLGAVAIPIDDALTLALTRGATVEVVGAVRQLATMLVCPKHRTGLNKSAPTEIMALIDGTFARRHG